MTDPRDIEHDSAPRRTHRPPSTRDLVDLVYELSLLYRDRRVSRVVTD